MPKVKYTDDDGLAHVTLVPTGTHPEHFKWGVPVGPPDLSALGLEREKMIALQAALVDLDLLVAPQLMGQRPVLLDILNKLGLPREMVKDLIGLYQQAYYG